MEKTLSTINHLLSGLATHYNAFSKEFQMLVKGIGEARTKHEEDRIVRGECKCLRERLKQPDISKKLMKEYLVRLIYCEMLGHDATFGHFQAVKFAQQSSLLEKRVGYLAVCLLLHEGHELVVLLINTLQRDLKSSNMLENCMALTVVSKVVGVEMIPAVLPAVVAKLKHSKEIVRRKAILAVQHFYQKSPSSVIHLQDDFRRALCDKDPGVMEASLGLFHDIAKDDPRLVKDLSSSFVAILKQILEHKLPKNFEYHQVPAPWMQMRILRILAMIGIDDLKCSECMYEVIGLCIDKTDQKSPICFAVLYECIRTVTLIYPNSVMIQRCANNVGRFLSPGSNNNLKCLGITALTALTAVEPKVAAEHQMVVIECLDDPDETLKRKTLDLLYKMTNPVNVEIICERLINYLRSTVDQYLRTDLVLRITQLAERYSPNNAWFIHTMNCVFELGGHLVGKDVTHNLLRLIAEGTDDEAADTELRIYAVSSYMDLIEKPCLPDILIQIIAWVLGEYAYLVEDFNLDEILRKLIGLLDRHFSDSLTSGWIVSAASKLVSQMGRCPAEAKQLYQSCSFSSSVELQQRACELQALTENLTLMSQVLPVDASCEDVEVDPSLSFLDQYVADSLMKGSSRYKPLSQRRNQQQQPSIKESTGGLNFVPYAAPQKPSAAVSPPPPPPSQPTVLLQAAAALPSESPASQQNPSPSLIRHTTVDEETGKSGLVSKAPRVWGRSGYKGKSSPAVQRKSEEEEAPIMSPMPVAPMRSQPVEEAEEVGSSGASDSVEVSEEKLQLASALFGGVGVSTKFTKKNVAGLKKKQPVMSRGRPAASPAPAPAPTIFPAPVPVPAQSSSSSVDLLLDLEGLDLTGGGAVLESQSSSVQSQGVSHPKIDIGDLLGNVEQTKKKSSLDRFEFSFMKKAGSPPPPTSPLSSPSEQPSLPSFVIPEELQGYPTATQETQDVCFDPSLRVTCRKIFLPDQLAIVFYMTNQRSSVLKNVAVQLELPGSFQGRVDESDELEWEKDIESFATSVHVLKVKAKQPELQMNLRGNICLRGTSQQRLFFTLPIEISDLLRPAVEMTTSEFGALWSKGRSLHEAKLNISSPTVQNPAHFMDIAKEKFNLHPIQIIGKEGIVAGNFLSSSLQCLIHGKVLSPGKLDVWIKTGHSLMTGAVRKMSETVFK